MIAAWLLACEQDMEGRFTGPIRGRVLVDGVRTDIAVVGPVDLAREGDGYTLSVLGCALAGRRDGAVLEFGPGSCALTPPDLAPLRFDGVTAHVSSVTRQRALGLWTEIVRVQVVVDAGAPIPTLRMSVDAAP